MSNIINGITTQQNLARAIEIVEVEGCWFYSQIQDDLGIPYHKAKQLKNLLVRMGILDNHYDLVVDWRAGVINDR